MRMIADLMLMAGALGAALYCLVLSRRLRKLSDLETGLGGAIAVLSAQVTDMARAIDEARTTAQTTAAALDKATVRAETSARRLELLMASLHDLPEPTAERAKAAPPSGRAPPTPEVTRKSPSFSSSRDVRQERVP